jgi:site-specific DNA-methyltransferase (cytosine-N4-specific)
MKVTLEMKNYIQPFERILALEELKGLLNDVDLSNVNLDKTGKISIDTNVSPEFLRLRLAYWEKIGLDTLKPTQQVIIESTQANNGDYKLQYDLLGDPIINIHQTRRLRYGPHDIHEYRGKFFPQLVKALINIAGINSGSIVVDPFCGSGTTNCEARALGMQTIGVDLNPLSVKISKTKTALVSVHPEELRNQTDYVLSLLEKIDYEKKTVELRWEKEDLEYLYKWFDKNALNEIQLILNTLDQIKNSVLKNYFEICLSNIIRSVSWQKESDLRVRKEVTEYIKGTAIHSFKEEVIRQTQRLLPYLEVLPKLDSFPTFQIVEGDTRKIDELFHDKLGHCDLLITSPPYATALPYLDTDRLSLVILNLLPRSQYKSREYDMIGNREISEAQRIKLWETYQQRRSELTEEICQLIDGIALYNHKDGVGFRRRNLPALISKYFLDILDSMKSSRKLLKPESYAFYVVGNNSTVVNGKKVEIKTDKLLWDLGEKAGWTKEKYIDMELLPSRDIFKNNRGTSESILIFKNKG